MNIQVGDTLTLKKEHPCGGKNWEVLRIGADFKIRCAKCGHEVMRPRVTVEKAIKAVTRGGEAVPLK